MMDWFRWHHGAVTDPKFQLIARRASATVAEVIAVWACILEEASKSDQRGVAGQIDSEATDCALGLPDGRTDAILSAMYARGILAEGGVVVSWEKRQPKRERDDSSADRVREFRRKQAEQKQSVTVTSDNVTPCNANETQETPRGEEIREEEKKQKKEQGQRSPKGSRLPPDWVPPHTLWDWAKKERPDLNLRQQTERFLDYWTAKPGKDGVKLDWGATWRNWIRNARTENQTTGARNETHRNLSAVERVRESAIAGELADRAARQPNGHADLVGQDGGDLRTPLDLVLWGGGEPGGGGGYVG